MLPSVEMKDYMTSDPVRIKADADVHEGIRLLLAYKVSGLCVVDDAGHLIGVLSELDCLRAILSSVYNKNPVGHVHEYMTREVITVQLSDNIVDTASDMLKHKHRRRPVVQDDGLLIGQVTCRQLLNAVQQFAAQK